LLSFSLVSTGLIGFYLTTFPSYAELLLIHGLWGITTILTFWAALIKATRLWGKPDSQGTTFGLLDGGRGLVAGLLLTVATALFASYKAQDVALALRSVISFYAGTTLVAGLATWFLLPDDQPGPHPSATRTAARQRLRAVLRLPQVWLISLVVFAAYWLYITSYDFPAFAEKTYGVDPVFGATLGTFRDWLRPVAAIGAGLLADRLRGTRVIALCFGSLVVGYGMMALGPTDTAYLWLLWVEVAVIATCLFALRGVYYALLQEGKIPVLLTGTAVGIISVIGYVPDSFGYLLIGWFVDEYGAASGYAAYFGLMSTLAAAGLIATLLLRRVVLAQPTQKSSPAQA